MTDLPTPEELEQLFHETYERLAPEYGYKTREASAKPWSEVPEDNRNLMVATCKAVLERLGQTVSELPPVKLHGYLPAAARLELPPGQSMECQPGSSVGGAAPRIVFDDLQIYAADRYAITMAGFAFEKSADIGLPSGTVRAPGVITITGASSSPVKPFTAADVQAAAKSLRDTPTLVHDDGFVYLDKDGPIPPEDTERTRQALASMGIDYDEVGERGSDYVQGLIDGQRLDERHALPLNRLLVEFTLPDDTRDAAEEVFAFLDSAEQLGATPDGLGWRDADLGELRVWSEPMAEVPEGVTALHSTFRIRDDLGRELDVAAMAWGEGYEVIDRDMFKLSGPGEPTADVVPAIVSRAPLDASKTYLVLVVEHPSEAHHG